MKIMMKQRIDILLITNRTTIMKRVLFSMVLLMAVSTSFAQMKKVKEAKSIASEVKPNFNQAEQLINEAMNNSETKELPETWDVAGFIQRSEEHTSELQSRQYLVCRLLLEKKKKKKHSSLLL